MPIFKFFLNIYRKEEVKKKREKENGKENEGEKKRNRGQI